MTRNILAIACLLLPQIQGKETLPPPNILWITAEDMSPKLGCYGDTYATTPNIDALAAKGITYLNAFTHAPVCSPSRNAVITSTYPTSTGSHHMRCKGLPPRHVKCFSEYLRKKGYYCTNQRKTDYQLGPVVARSKDDRPYYWSPLGAWDETGSFHAHYRNRQEGQPFFTVLNFHESGEYNIRRDWDEREQLPAEVRHDPAKAPLPPYYPDHPVIRRDIALDYDNIHILDLRVGEVLEQLRRDQLDDDTIIVFWSDHGSGLLRHMRSINDSGTRIALVVYVPEKYRDYTFGDQGYQEGQRNEELVAAIDFAPTMLKLTGCEVPAHMKGRVFFGKHKQPEPPYVFFHRDRMDESMDCIRSVRDKRFRYIRNYMPSLAHIRPISYRDKMPSNQELHRIEKTGTLNAVQQQMYNRKDVEELYDVQKDPHEVNNLAKNPDYADVLKKMRNVQQNWSLETADIGLIPEADFNDLKGSETPQMNKPTITLEGEKVALSSPLPECSVIYQVASSIENLNRYQWQIYMNPVTLPTGCTIYAKAGCLGYQPSDLATYRKGDDLPPASPKQKVSKHWSEKIDSQLLRRIQKVKNFDLLEKDSLTEYRSLIDDQEPLVRYWAIRGLACWSDEKQLLADKASYEKALTDTSSSVRLQAAKALFRLDRQHEGAIKLINNQLLSGPVHKRFAALQAIDELVVEDLAPFAESMRELQALAIQTREKAGTTVTPWQFIEFINDRLLKNQ